MVNGVNSETIFLDEQKAKYNLLGECLRVVYEHLLSAGSEIVVQETCSEMD